jgi:hypothetical protein
MNKSSEREVHRFLALGDQKYERKNGMVRFIEEKSVGLPYIYK